MCFKHHCGRASVDYLLLLIVCSVLCSCNSTGQRMSVITSGHELHDVINTHVTIHGVARSYSGKDVVLELADETLVRIRGLRRWPTNVEGHLVEAKGILLYSHAEADGSIAEIRAEPNESFYIAECEWRRL